MKFKDNKTNYWFTADSHYWHTNIVKGKSKWADISACRDFPDERAMSTHIVDKINMYVMPDDILFHLGDWSFGGIQNIWNFRKRLNVKNIYLCLGNHDHHIKKNKILPNVYGNALTDFGFPKEFTEEETPIGVKARGLFTNVQPMYEIQIHGQRMTLCHYSMRTWYFHNKGSWMLFGHSHGSLQPPGRTIDVGVDNVFTFTNEYRPISFQELQKIMAKKDIDKPDHHSPKTNP